MAVSMRFLARPAATSWTESIVSNSPKSPKAPASFGLSPLASMNSLNNVSFFPENAPEVEKPKAFPTHSIFENGSTWFENATRHLGDATRHLGGPVQQAEQPQAEASPITDLATAASVTRDAVMARFARRERTASEAPEVPSLPTLRRASRARPHRGREGIVDVDVSSCAEAARRAVVEQRERRASRAMVDFVV
eukprot:Skav209692  [mRNA]  locus=scaffold36:9174:9755:+ [translate_table: standard]